MEHVQIRQVAPADNASLASLIREVFQEHDAPQNGMNGTGFLRIHKSYIISIHHLTAIRKNAVFIGNTELPVGEQYREAIARLAGGEY